ncbi:hypothetical protein ACS15_5080 [Ralstonia insidiosa]|uniref:Uncharacterized protein n=1 Tax=Ralstonia insidiosa TaxID=190721 RepID=A0AAC9FTN1_9RALS|nr:hypothetical protein ACS15_5080 [Ralstonia insidiosa]
MGDGHGRQRGNRQGNSVPPGVWVIQLHEKDKDEMGEARRRNYAARAKVS